MTEAAGISNVSGQPRWFMRLAYDGTPFCGWQRQPNAPSVQQRLEEALSTVLRRDVPVTGAGRTDTGVHARCMYAHFNADLQLAEVPRLVTSLNRLTGREIVVNDIIPVLPTAHARFDATSRTYRYFIATRQDPFHRGYSWWCPAPLDVRAMQTAADMLPAVSDFTSFAKLHSDARTNFCRLSEARFFSSRDMIVFQVTADRFLRNMVRALVGTLVEVGRGKLNLDGFRRVVEAKDRCAAGTSMPPQALFLWDVKYPYIR